MRMLARLLIIVAAVFSSGLRPCVAEESTSNWTSGKHKIVVAGLEREFVLDVPANTQPKALVWVFHGYTGSIDSIRGSSDLAALAQEYGFVVIYPQGTRDSRGKTFFNVGYEFHKDEKVDDVSFVRTMTDRITKDLKLDPRQVFATGMSNGGDMCFVLASEEKQIVRAIAPVAGTMMKSRSDGFVPKHRVSVLAVHGTADRVTKWAGDIDNRDGWGSYLSVDSVLKLWTEGQNLTLRTTKIVSNSESDKRIERRHWTNPKDKTEVQFFKIIKGRHSWPRTLGASDQSTATVICNFFKSHLVEANPSTELQPKP